MRKTFLCFLIALTIFSLCLSGCWNKRELDTLGIVTALGIDKAKDSKKFNLTYQILIPAEAKPPSAGGGGGGGNSSTKSVWTMTSYGNTLFEAIRNATTQSDRKLFLAQNRIIVIGEELARFGLSKVMDVLERDPEFRRLNWFIISKGDAKNIIETQHPQEIIPAIAIENLVKASSATSQSVQVTLHDFLKKMTSKSTDAVAPCIMLINSQDTETQNSQNQNRLKINGAAMFKNDKLVGWLDEKEARGLNWVLGKVKSGVIVVKSPYNEKDLVSLEIIRASSKIIPSIENEKIKILVEIHEEGNIAEQPSDADFTRLDKFTMLEQRQSAAIKEEVEATLSKAKELKADIFGFGEAVHRKYPKEWKKIREDWRDLLPYVEVSVKVDAKLRAVGIITNPDKVKE